VAKLEYCYFTSKSESGNDEHIGLGVDVPSLLSLHVENEPCDVTISFDTVLVALHRKIRLRRSCLYLVCLRRTCRRGQAEEQAGSTGGDTIVVRGLRTLSGTAKPTRTEVFVSLIWNVCAYVHSLFED
jgi:hypothetical protein